ncbi:hypothetical protein SFRURICE_004527 [Spodoptera frugiperda]|nr:hypothetical protein SFRURICE_004527 [Spodoptera frugiperda]
MLCLVDRVVASAGLGFDSRVGQSTTGLFSVFRKFLSGARSLELCPVYGNRLILYYNGMIAQMVKSGYYPFGDKRLSQDHTDCVVHGRLPVHRGVSCPISEQLAEQQRRCRATIKYYKMLLQMLFKKSLPRWSSHYVTSGIVGEGVSIPWSSKLLLGLFTEFRKILSSSTESGIVPSGKSPNDFSRLGQSETECQTLTE